MRTKEAPRIVNASVWTAVFAGVLVFSVSLSAYFFGFLDNQISADTEDASKTLSSQSGKCPAGKIPVTINNYPAGSLIGGTHSKYYLSESDMNFRCSHICIKANMTLGADSDKISDADLGLEGAKIGENDLIQFASVEDFNTAIQKGGTDKENAMKYGIIVSKTRGGKGCQGPNSVDYGKITDKEGNPITMLDRNDTSYEPAAQAEEIVAGKEIVESRDITGVGTMAGASTPLGAPAGGGGSTGDKDTATEVKECLEKVKTYLDTKPSSWLARATQSLARYQVKLAYNKLLKADKNQKALDQCNALIKKIGNNMPKNADPPKDTSTGTKTSTTVSDQNDPYNLDGKTMYVYLKYNGKKQVNSLTHITLYSVNKDNTLRPIEEKRWRTKGATMSSTTFELKKYRDLETNKIIAYAVTEGGWLSFERWGASSIILNPKRTDPYQVTVDMNIRAGTKLTSVVFSDGSESILIPYVSYKEAESGQP